MKETNSRLSRRLESQSKHRIALTLFGIFLILFLLIKFGIPLFINFSLFIAGTKNSQDAPEKNTSHEFIAPPTLNQTFTATNSATISITGSALPKQKIQLYINDEFTDVTSTKRDGSFVFEQITLPKEQNTIKTKVKEGNNQSDFSNIITITYLHKDVSLTVDSPQDGQTFSKDQNDMTINGKTDPDSTITINDFRAIVDEKGNYSYAFHLQNGDNHIKVTATDAAGNKTEKELKVTYSP